MCSRHVIRAGAQDKSNNRQAGGRLGVQSVWRRSCVYAAYADGDCLRRLLMTCGRLCQRCAVPCLSMQISILGDDHSIMRQTHGTHTHSQIHSTHSHTCRQTSAWVEQFVAYFQAPAEIHSRCVRLCKLFATRPEVALAPSSPSWPCHAQWAWQVIWQHTFQFALCLPFCFVVSFVGLPDMPSESKKGEAKVKRRQSLKPHGKLAKEFYAANRCSNCARLALVRVCVIFSWKPH